MTLASPQEVMQRLDEIEAQMATNQNALEAAAMTFYSCKREVDVERAKATLRQKGGTVAEREAQALLEVSSGDLWQKFVPAEAAYESLKLAQRSLADRASIGQSILRAQKAA